MSQSIIRYPFSSSFFFNATAPTELYTLSLHDALPILQRVGQPEEVAGLISFLISEDSSFVNGTSINVDGGGVLADQDRKSTRLNSSHVAISYAGFCLKKKIIRFRKQRD